MFSGKRIREGLYPLGDRCPGISYLKQHKLQARWTGEYRKPKAGEWYLSGAQITAYRTKGDLDSAYHIAEIVEVKEIKTYEIVRTLS